LILTPNEDKPEDAFISGIFGHFFSLSGNKHRLSGQPLYGILAGVTPSRSSAVSCHDELENIQLISGNRPRKINLVGKPDRIFRLSAASSASELPERRIFRLSPALTATEPPEVWWPLQGNFDHLYPEYEILDWRGYPYYTDSAESVGFFLFG